MLLATIEVDGWVTLGAHSSSRSTLEIFSVHVRLFVENDVVATLACGTMGKLHGCVLSAGTSTIAYGFTEDGREAQAAGAGPILGDWGNGYGIAAQALTAIIRAHDGRGPPTMLASNILNKLGLSSPDELIGWTFSFTYLEQVDLWDIGKEVVNCLSKVYPGTHPVHPKNG